MCEREREGEGEMYSLMITLADGLLDKTWTHCPSNSLAESLIQCYLKMLIPSDLVMVDCDMGKQLRIVFMYSLQVPARLNNLMPSR